MSNKSLTIVFKAERKIMKSCELAKGNNKKKQRTL